MECRALTPAELPIWDAFVASLDTAMPFHRRPWLEAVDGDVAIYACFADSKIIAGLPLVRQRRDGLLVAQQPALTPYLGVIWQPASQKKVARRSQAKEIASAIAAAVVKDHDSVTINFAPEWDDLQGFMWQGFSTAVRYTYLLQLGDLEAAWNEMDGRRRNDIRRAEKDGVAVSRSDDFEALLRLVGTTFARQGLSPRWLQTARALDAFLRQEERCALFTSSGPNDATPSAAVYVIWDQRRAYYLLGGYDESRAHGGAHALTMWRAIEFAAGRGLQLFDFEGSNIPQVEKYFRKFGGDLTPYYSVSWTSPRARMIGSAVNAAKLTLRAARRLLRSIGPRGKA